MGSKKITATSLFKKSLKRLAKRFPSIKTIYENLLEDLENNEQLGDEISGCEDYYKVRYPNPDAKRGKSGGFRIIFLKRKNSLIIILIDAYSKTDQNEMDWEKVKKLKEEIKEIEEKNNDN